MQMGYMCLAIPKVEISFLPLQLQWIGCDTYLMILMTILLMFIYFERERERQSVSREGAEREGNIESETGSRI